MSFPRIVSQVRFRRWGVSGASRGRGAIEGAMDASLVVIGADVFDFAMKVDRIPEERVVEIFAPDGRDQSFHEWVRHRDIGHRLVLLDLEDP